MIRGIAFLENKSFTLYSRLKVEGTKKKSGAVCRAEARGCLSGEECEAVGRAEAQGYLREKECEAVGRAEVRSCLMREENEAEGRAVAQGCLMGRGECQAQGRRPSQSGCHP